MRITPADLQPEPLALDLCIQPGVIDYATDVVQCTPLRLAGIADRIEEHRGPREFVEDIRVRARAHADFELLCARCLTTIPRYVDVRFDLIFRPAGVDAEQGERSISEAETEIGYYENGGLVLEEVIREQVVLSLPERSLCRETCKGLCAHCGGNLNEADCECHQAEVDPRWNALQSFAGAMKQ